MWKTTILAFLVLFMDSMLSSQEVVLATAMEVSGASVHVLALRLQESSQTTQFSIGQIPHSSQQVNLRSCISSAVYAMLMNILIGQFTGNLRQTLINHIYHSLYNYRHVHFGHARQPFEGWSKCSSEMVHSRSRFVSLMNSV